MLEQNGIHLDVADAALDVTLPKATTRSMAPVPGSVPCSV
jgi:hypothetical protein